MNNILESLAQVLEQRKTADSGKSYVASLHEQGINKILEKLGEETLETILAAKDCALSDTDDKKLAVVKETADLWFHSMVLLSHLDLKPEQVLEELGKRFNISGLAEKASRGN